MLIYVYIYIYISAFGHHHHLPVLDIREIIFWYDDYHCPRIRTKNELTKQYIAKTNYITSCFYFYSIYNSPRSVSLSRTSNKIHIHRYPRTHNLCIYYLLRISNSSKLLFIIICFKTYMD